MGKKNKHKRKKKAQKFPVPIPILIYAVIGLVVLLFTFALFLYFRQGPANVYVFPENPKQGDTVFIRVRTSASEVAGRLGVSSDAQGEQALVFYKKGNSNERVSFFGIDANKEPGEYKIFIDTSNAEHIIKDIKVELADFSVAPAVSAPSAKKTGVTVEKAVNNITTNDGPALKKVLSNFTSTPYFNAPFSLPLSVVQKAGYTFGRFITFGQYKLQHYGVDLQAYEDTAIYAVNDGKVVATLDLSNYGKTVIIDHGLDIFSLYLHLDEFKVAEGDMVKRGQRIGLSGKTGYVTAPHLHFSMRVGASRVDPLNFIETTKKLNDNFFLADLSGAFMSLFK